MHRVKLNPLLFCSQSNVAGEHAIKAVFVMRSGQTMVSNQLFCSVHISLSCLFNVQQRVQPMLFHWAAKEWLYFSAKEQ